MIRFIDGLTGVEALVADERKDEYLGAGYILASESNEFLNPPEDNEDIHEIIPEDKPKTAKKKTSKKK